MTGLNKHEPNLCKHPQGIDGAAIVYLDKETTKFYERPAYELTIACLEEKKKDFSLFSRLFGRGCVEQINHQIENRSTRYKEETGESL